MSDSLSIEVNSAKFFADLDELAYHYGLNKSKVLDYGITKLIDRLWDFMPSKTKGIGVKAIRKDWSQQYADSSYFESNFVSRRKTQSSTKQQDKIREYFANGEFDKLQLIQQKGAGLFQDVEFKGFDKTDLHHDSRGRVHRYGKLIICTTPEHLKAERQEKYNKVGRLKGSFIPAREFFGSNKAPKWIKSNSEGYFSRTGDTKSTLVLTAGSSIGYGQILNQQYNLINRVYATKARDIERMIEVDVLNKALSVKLA